MLYAETDRSGYINLWAPSRGYVPYPGIYVINDQTDHGIAVNAGIPDQRRGAGEQVKYVKKWLLCGFACEMIANLTGNTFEPATSAIINI
jgi:hypothetical protein